MPEVLEDKLPTPIRRLLDPATTVRDAGGYIEGNGLLRKVLND
jgi:hypothetical protein